VEERPFVMAETGRFNSLIENKEERDSLSPFFFGGEGCT